MPRSPTRSACFQPDTYQDLELFADRQETLEDFVQTLSSFLDPDGPGQGRILVRGNRGIGKSMLVRKAVQQVMQTIGPLVAEVDCADNAHGPDVVLRRLAGAVAREVLENATEAALRGEAELLLRLTEVTKVRVRDVRSWTSSLRLGVSLNYKLSDKVQFEFGMARLSGRSREVEESSERNIDALFLQDLIRDFLADCRYANMKAVVFVDNLDQAGFAEIESDVGRVTDLARYLFGLRNCLVVATMRTEFVSADLNKLYSHELAVKGLAPEELAKIAHKRMSRCGERQQCALREARFEEIIQVLATWTDNAWALLTWLEDLDYALTEFKPDSPEELRAVLLPLAQQHHPGVRQEELVALASCFNGEMNGFRTSDELTSGSISEELRQRGLKYGALVPDWLLSPDRYMLSPRLHFLVSRPSSP